MKRGLVVIGTGLLAVGLAACGDSDSGGDAVAVCHNAVENELRSPASADFDTLSIEETPAGGWRVEGTVDADNAFGASIRNDFSCSISPTGAVSRVSVG